VARRRIMQPLAFEVSGLRKTYPGGVEAVKGIDFAVAAGKVCGLLGPNGGFTLPALRSSTWQPKAHGLPEDGAIIGPGA
jgi:ABC-type branched-subunit amino acid transport system ATPase component